MRIHIQISKTKIKIYFFLFKTLLYKILTLTIKNNKSGWYYLHCHDLQKNGIIKIIMIEIFFLHKNNETHEESYERTYIPFNKLKLKRI